MNKKTTKVLAFLLAALMASSLASCSQEQDFTAGMSEEEAKREAPIMREAQQMLRRWEAKDPEVYSLWETMNGWVYELTLIHI